MGSTGVTVFAGPVIVVDIETSADPCLTPTGPSGNPMPISGLVS